MLTAISAKTTATFSSQYTVLCRMPCFIWMVSMMRLMMMTLARMMIMATITEMGSTYISVVVGMMTAVQTPEGMM